MGSEVRAPAAPVIEVRDLVRRFGEVEAVRGISFSVQAGSVVGFVGANGAGKTTTMRMMVTLDVPTSGTVNICGFDAQDQPEALRHRVGWMPDSYGAYADVTAGEYLDFMARAFGFVGPDRRRRVHEVIEFTELGPLREREMKALSKGEGQRLCLARALINDPEVMVLDEPAAGLDPKARAEFKRLVRILAEDGKTIFISSHILSELAEMCDALLFIDQGKVLYEGPPEGLTRPASAGVEVVVGVFEGQDSLLQWAQLAPGIEVLEVRRQGVRLLVEDPSAEGVAAVLRRMVQDGLRVDHFARQEVRLEDAFIGLLDKIKGKT